MLICCLAPAPCPAGALAVRCAAPSAVLMLLGKPQPNTPVGFLASRRSSYSTSCHSHTRTGGSVVCFLILAAMHCSLKAAPSSPWLAVATRAVDVVRMLGMVLAPKLHLPYGSPGPCAGPSSQLAGCLGSSRLSVPPMPPEIRSSFSTRVPVLHPLRSTPEQGRWMRFLLCSCRALRIVQLSCCVLCTASG